MEISLKDLKELITHEDKPKTLSPQPDILQIHKGKPVHVETVTKYYSGVLEYINDDFIHLTQAQWVQSTGRYEAYTKDPEGDDKARYEPCPDVTISRGAIVSILNLPKIVRKLK